MRRRHRPASAMFTHPRLHGREQLRRELAIAGEQREIGVLRLVQAVEAKVGVAAVLDGFGIAGFSASA